MKDYLILSEETKKRLRKVISKRSIKDPKRKELLDFFNSHANRKV